MFNYNIFASYMYNCIINLMCSLYTYMYTCRSIYTVIFFMFNLCINFSLSQPEENALRVLLLGEIGMYNMCICIVYKYVHVKMQMLSF